MPEELLLDVRHLRTEFSQGKKSSVVAVNDVTFQIRKGEILGLVGESGCRKSVTALSIMQLLKDTPGKITNGEVCLEGKNLLECSKEEMRKIRGENVAMIFQEPMSSLNPAMRIDAQLVEAIRLHTGKTRREAEEHALKMLGLVGIPDPARVSRNYPHQLSGGMSQRVTKEGRAALECDGARVRRSPREGCGGRSVGGEDAAAARARVGEGDDGAVAGPERADEASGVALAVDQRSQTADQLLWSVSAPAQSLNSHGEPLLV